MKVLLDANVSREFEALLTDALEDTDVVHSVDLGWERKHNGELQQAGLAAGFTHLVTHDKSMADEHYPHLPVLALDDPGQGEDGRRPDDLSPDEVRAMHIASAQATADVLCRDPPSQPGYYGIVVPDYKPRKALQRIIDGEFRMNPNRKSARDLWDEKQTQRAGGDHTPPST